MCGRYANHVGAMHGWTDILTDWPTDAQMGFNLAPTQMIPVFTENGGEAMRWGLIPNWLQQPSSRFSTFNARLTTIAEKPTFRHAWQQRQRCLIPALGYYEWRQEEGRKQAYFVCRSDDAPIVFAGLFEPARGASVPSSCTILTRPSEGKLQPLHHAMPVMLSPQQAETWYRGDPEQAANVAWQDYGDEFKYYKVSDSVNNVRNQGATLIEPQVQIRQAQQGFDFS